MPSLQACLTCLGYQQGSKAVTPLGDTIHPEFGFVLCSAVQRKLSCSIAFLSLVITLWSPNPTPTLDCFSGYLQSWRQGPVPGALKTLPSLSSSLNRMASAWSVVLECLIMVWLRAFFFRKIEKKWLPKLALYKVPSAESSGDKTTQLACNYLLKPSTAKSLA